MPASPAPCTPSTSRARSSAGSRRSEGGRSVTADHDPATGAEATTAVLGLGNVLQGDDALGPTVVAHLAARFTFDDTVQVEDLGTPGLDLHPHLAGRTALIMVDTVRADGPAGELRLYRKDDILRHGPPVRLGPHDPSFKEALLALQFAGGDPDEVLLVGVIPASTEASTDLSPPVAAAVEPAIAAVCEELARLGHPAEARAVPDAPHLWWRAPADGSG
ncbi:hydrogenase maturation protease [bacterium]|nr:hydrogenase maturation protease [bacterium]